MMRIINKQNVLTNVFYVSNFDVNLLFEKTLCVSESKKNFDENDLYLHDKYNKQIFKISDRRKLYIVNKITFQLNDYVLTASKIFRTIVMSALIDRNDNDIIN